MPVTQNTIPYILSILILIDAFEDAGDKRGGGGTSSEEKVHVRVQQRNGRKCITTVAGLADDLDIKRICKAFKKNFSCNGAVQKDLEVGEVIQLSGDQRVSTFFCLGRLVVPTLGHISRDHVCLAPLNSNPETFFLDFNLLNRQT